MRTDRRSEPSPNAAVRGPRLPGRAITRTRYSPLVRSSGRDVGRCTLQGSPSPSSGREGSWPGFASGPPGRGPSVRAPQVGQHGKDASVALSVSHLGGRRYGADHHRRAVPMEADRNRARRPVLSDIGSRAGLAEPSSRCATGSSMAARISSEVTRCPPPSLRGSTSRLTPGSEERTTWQMWSWLD